MFCFSFANFVVALMVAGAVFGCEDAVERDIDRLPELDFVVRILGVLYISL